MTVFVSKMVDGASKLDERLDGVLFAMFVIAALQLLVQDGVERDFWKFDGLLVCHDKSELNLDKIIVFNNKDKDKDKYMDKDKDKLLCFENSTMDGDSNKDDLRKGLTRCENFLP